MKNITHDKKYNNRKTKKEKLKRAIPMHVREKLRERKNAKNHEKRTRERLNKTVGAIKPQDRTQKTKDEDDEINEYDDYISKVARAIVKAKGVKIPKNMDKDIQDMIEFGKKLRDVSITISSGKRGEYLIARIIYFRFLRVPVNVRYSQSTNFRNGTIKRNLKLPKVK